MLGSKLTQGAVPRSRERAGLHRGVNRSRPLTESGCDSLITTEREDEGAGTSFHASTINPILSDRQQSMLWNVQFFRIRGDNSCMDISETEQLFRTGDSSPEAIRKRLIAARECAGLKQQELAKAVGIGKTTYNSQEVKGAPAIKVVRHLYKAHRIDFNYIYHGDFAQLPIDVQSRLAEALAAGAQSKDRS